MPTNALADLIISRFRVEKMEGGVVVAGRSFRTASQCPTLILLFSGCFLVAGVVLTVLAYRPLTNSNTHYLSHLSGSQIGGPLLVVFGLLFLGIGLALHIVSQRLKLPDQARRRAGSGSSGRPSWFRRWGIVSRAWKFVRKPTKTLSSRKKKVVQDLLASTDFICMIERSKSMDSYESHDVASFPDTCVPVFPRVHPSRTFRSSSPELKTRL